jgi:putative FmdB family regulatory protein
MPTYEYKCDACGKGFERFESIMAAPLKKCPYCSKRKVRRLISGGAGLIFKGSGFYITDYRSESYKKAAQGDSGGGSATAATASSGSSATGAGGGNGASSAGATPAAPAKREAKSPAEK